MTDKEKEDIQLMVAGGAFVVVILLSLAIFFAWMWTDLAINRVEWDVEYTNERLESLRELIRQEIKILRDSVLAMCTSR